MVGEAFFREQTSSEKKDFKPLMGKSVKDTFFTKLALAEQEFHGKRVPFCQKCAISEFEDTLDKREKEIKRTAKTEEERLKRISKIEFGDFTKFSGEEHFKPINTPSEVRVDRQTKDGIRHSYLEGYIVDFKCERGCGDSLEIKADLWNEWKKKYKIGGPEVVDKEL